MPLSKFASSHPKSSGPALDQNWHKPDTSAPASPWFPLEPLLELSLTMPFPIASAESTQKLIKSLSHHDQCFCHRRITHPASRRNRHPLYLQIHARNSLRNFLEFNPSVHKLTYSQRIRVKVWNISSDRSCPRSSSTLHNSHDHSEQLQLSASTRWPLNAYPSQSIWSILENTPWFLNFTMHNSVNNDPCWLHSRISCLPDPKEQKRWRKRSAKHFLSRTTHWLNHRRKRKWNW